MRLRAVSILALLVLAVAAMHAQDRSRSVSFNLSTSKTFAPGEQPKIHLYTHNVEALEFRIYRVKDPVKFMENLRELHSFGPEASLLGPEHIDERTWLEKFHDWKAGLWWNVRHFFRLQFSSGARDSLRDRQSSIRSSRIVSEAEFAQIPILNASQLVSRWRQIVPPTFISDSNDLAVPKLSAGLYLLEATDGRYKAYTLLMVTQMVLVTRTTSGAVLAYTVDRATGQPIPGARVQMGFGQTLTQTVVADANGIAIFPVAPDKSTPPDNFWVAASKGDEFAVSAPASWMFGMSTAASTGKYAGYAFTDRPVYRPTHTVHWKAILREHDGNALVLPRAGTVQVTITDETDKKVFDQPMPVSAAGDVTGDFDLPRDASLGYYYLRVGAANDSPGDAVSTSFHVEEYRKPEYRVQVTSAKKRVLEGATMPVTIDSRYFFGEPVANAKVKYRIYQDRHYWWGESQDDSANADNSGDADAQDSAGDAGDEQAEKTAKLGADGTLVIQVPTHVDTQGVAHPDLDYTVEAGVTDAANREITGRGRFLATYSTFRINIEPVTYAVHTGDMAKFRVTAVDYDDQPVSTRVHVQLVFHHYNAGKTDTISGAAVDVTTDASGHATGELSLGSSPYSSAELQATAAAVQPGTSDPVDDASLWIMGAGEIGWDNSTETVQIVADKKSYAPGDTAHLSLVSESSGFYALVIAQGYTLQKRDVMHTDGKTLAFDLPIAADSQPDVTVDAIFIKNSTLYQATKILKVPPAQQQLQVQITPAKDVFQPQQSAVYDVLTKDFSGKPVSADLSFGMVDEAIYSLYPDSSGDMVRSLYPPRNAESFVDSSLDYYFSGEAGAKSPLLALRQARYRPQLAQVKPGNEAKPRVRKAFPDTAYWAPLVHTDVSGHARVSLTFPDSLTTWRATVHAITPDSKAGSAISRVLVRKNILVRMGTPRFLIKGDEITLPVIVHNYFDIPKQTTISLKIEGLDALSGSQQSVMIPSKGEATLLWRLRGSQVGTAKLTATALTDAESDALELSFPVEPAGVLKTQAQSGVVKPAAERATTRIAFPANTDVAAHSLQVEVSPSIAGSLFSALDYLATYPYGCTEQTMSSYLPNVIVAETLDRLKVNGHVDQAGLHADLHAKMQAGLARLADYQHEDGGWGWWKEDASRVYMTAYVVSGVGQGAQYVPLTNEQRTMLHRGESYLHDELDQHPRMRPELRAAVVYALAEAGDNQVGNALDAQWSRRNDMQPEALAMTGLAMLLTHDVRAPQIAALLASEAAHQGDLVSWKGSYIPLLDTEYNNDAEATAYAVRLLAKVDPNNPLLTGAAQWLMLARNGGVWWDSTEQTAMVLFGLTDYLAASHELDSDFTVEILVNGHSAGMHHFTAADALSGASFSINVDAANLQPTDNNVQVVRRSGTGQMYWSATGHYYSTEKKDYQAGTLSLNLTRDYYKLQPVQKDGRIVYTLQPLNGAAQVGDVLAVHEAISGSPMRYLLLEDPIPAGTEFVTSEDSYPIDQRPGGWYDWFTRREFHDDHASFFASDFSGRQEVFYLIRVVNPGDFQISPAHVEPMYQHGVQASSDALHLQVPAPVLPGGPQ
jgi:uncharacterized protein YfaS (alpha-2-macroglobulin family)